MKRNELEIMAPAGSFDCLVAAIEGGADALFHRFRIESQHGNPEGQMDADGGDQDDAGMRGRAL